MFVSGSLCTTWQGEVPSRMASSGILSMMYSSRAIGRKNVASQGRMKPYLLSRMSFAVVMYDPRYEVRANLMAEGIGK